MHIHAEFPFADALRPLGDSMREQASRTAVAGYADELVSLFVHGDDEDEVLEDPELTGDPSDEDADPAADD